MENLSFLPIRDYQSLRGKTVSLELSYQTFGQDLNNAPIVLVNHALTGNSNVTGERGWWNDLIGEGKCIDTNVYAVLAFNIPGNGYCGRPENLIDNYKDFTAYDIAAIFIEGLEQLNISSIYAAIGGSVGGGLIWEIAAQRPTLIRKMIPIACDWKATAWLIGNCFIQDSILNNSKNALADARMHAMTLYRTPESFKEKFGRSLYEPGIFNVESWLNHHGVRINERFHLSAYKMMNQVLKTIDITHGHLEFRHIVETISSEIHIISINSDLFFKPSENRRTYTELIKFRTDVTFNEIRSIHGHDAFLIEYSQLSSIVGSILGHDFGNRSYSDLRAS